LTKADANNLNSGAVLRINARAPLAGKGSSIQAALSGDDGRIILARYTGVVNATASTSAPVQWGTKNYDSHNAVTTGSSWKFVAPISAWYEYSAAFRQTSTNTYAYAYKNGVIYERLRFLATDETSPVTGKIYLKAGDYFDIRTADSVTIAAESECAIAICRIGGNAVALARIPNDLRKAFHVRYNHSTDTILSKSANVSSVTDNGVGSFTVNFSPAFEDIDKVMIFITNDGFGSVSGTLTASAVQFATINQSLNGAKLSNNYVYGFYLD
jgi:hypothetical protein